MISLHKLIWKEFRYWYQQDQNSRSFSFNNWLTVWIQCFAIDSSISLITFTANMLICASKINAAVIIKLVAYWKSYACLFKSEIIELFSDSLTLIFRLKSNSRCFLYQDLINQFIFSIISLIWVIDFFYYVNLMKVKVKDSQKLKNVMQMKFLQIVNILS